MIADIKTCYEPFCLGVNTRIAIARQHMAMLETESNIKYKSTLTIRRRQSGFNRLSYGHKGSWPFALSFWPKRLLSSRTKG